jgi:hypothetical protein
MFLVFFYFSGTSKSGEEFQLSSYIDRLEIVIIILVATLFTLIVDLPIQNIKQLLKEDKNKSADTENVSTTEQNLLVENQNTEQESQPVEDDFENPFGDRDDDFIPVRPSYFKRDFEDSETESSRNYTNDDYNTQSNGDDLGAHADGEEDEEEEEEEDEEIPEESEIIRKPENTMNSRRWRWEVLDD